ncbi:hypothetical protein MRB53_040920 [Persea americana]|nr:hypothetical protein MRB53_040920 [Persea americana]
MHKAVAHSNWHKKPEALEMRAPRSAVDVGVRSKFDYGIEHTKTRQGSILVIRAGRVSGDRLSNSGNAVAYFEETLVPIITIINECFSSSIEGIAARWEISATMSHSSEPHAGHFYTLILSDVFKRWEVLKGDKEAALLTGTDEHGMKIQKAAEKAGTTPKELCDKNASQFAELAEATNISFNRFIRTTDPDHKVAVESFWTELMKRGHIYESTHEGWYSVSDETFYPESQVHYILDPHTGRKFNASKETGKEVEWTSETNYHFRLSAFQQRLSEHYEQHPNFIVPSSRMEFIKSEVAAGLKDLSISRPSSRLQWGIRVPGDDSQTIYVWLDALINYLTATGYPSGDGDRTKLWPPNVQVIGKDIIRFHTIYWPAFLMALDIPLPRGFLSHAHWTMGDEKMSKSLGNVVNPFLAIKRYGLDPMRYFMVYNGGIVDDAKYDNSLIVDCYKKGLQNGLGNLLTRIIRGRQWSIGKAVQSAASNSFLEKLKVQPLLANWVSVLDSTSKEADDAMQALNPRIIFTSSEALRITCILLQPFMPDKMKQALDDLRVLPENRTFDLAYFGGDTSYGEGVSELEQSKILKGKKQLSGAKKKQAALEAFFAYINKPAVQPRSSAQNYVSSKQIVDEQDGLDRQFYANFEAMDRDTFGGINRIFLKLENLQPSSSFKSRGIGNLILRAIEEQKLSNDTRPLHFHASSGGNAGLAAITAANMLGYPATIAVPITTEDSMVAKLRAAGASDVIVHGSNWFIADSYLLETVMKKAEESGEKAVYVPPFDHPLIWEGASTIVSEVRRQIPSQEAPDGIVCSVGGGGLFCGIMQGVEREGWSEKTRVLAVETVGADSLAQAVEKGELVKMSEITSVAKSLGAPIVAQQAFTEALKPNVTNMVIEDAEACASAWRFADDERFLVEPACGAAVALAYDGRLKKYLKNFSPESKVVIVVCGGSRIDLRTMDVYRKQFGARAQQLGLTRCEDVPSTHTS